MILKSYAKINLYLDVLRRREDGYHDIISIFQSISLHDCMRIEETEDGGVTFHSNDPSLRWDESNLIFKAYDLFFKRFDFPKVGLEIKLKKRIPKGCGFGGGSSNAAVLLLYLGKKFRIAIEDIENLAIEIGSDVKYFLHGGTALVQGRGDEVKLVDDLHGYSVNLRIPNLFFKTAEMYGKISKFLGKVKGSSKDPLALIEAMKSGNPESIEKNVFNIFERVILDEHPYLAVLLDRNSGITSSFTGKGPAVFTLYRGGSGRYRFVSREEFSSQGVQL